MGERIFMDEYCVYAIYNEKHNKIYIGQTKDLKERLELHNEKTFGKSYSSRFDGEWKLIYKEKVNDRKEALAREKQLKNYQGRKYIKQFIPNLSPRSSIG